MRKLTKMAVSCGMAVTAVAAMSAPALAAGTPTTATFTINAGTLSISAPASATLGAVSAGAATASGALGNVVVTDNRGLLAGGWTASVTSTTFVNGTSSIPNTAINYTAPIASVTGTVIVVPTSGALGSTLNAQVATSVLGSDTATWNPTITVTLPTTVVTGTYTATLTHSVA
jgi:hypothetical protein